VHEMADGVGILVKERPDLRLDHFALPLAITGSGRTG
jgi:hypothetical protein